jgi:hypothetical protein
MGTASKTNRGPVRFAKKVPSFDLLEDRVPVSENIGTAVAISTLSSFRPALLHSAGAQLKMAHWRAVWWSYWLPDPSFSAGSTSPRFHAPLSYPLHLANRRVFEGVLVPVMTGGTELFAVGNHFNRNRGVGYQVA